MLFEILNIVKSNDYLYCKTNPEHPRASVTGYHAVHRVVMENKLGRLLTENEIVHHIDGDKKNNHPDNLQVMTWSEHGKHHAKEAELVTLPCPNCGHKFTRSANKIAFKKKTNKYGLVFCSLSCATKYHSSSASQPVKLTCPTCGEKFQVLPSVYRRKMKIQKHGKLHCSRSCASKRVSNLELRIKRTSVSVRNT